MLQAQKFSASLSASISFFIAGLVWNAITLRRIDSTLQLTSQTIVLIIVSVLVTLKLRERYSQQPIPIIFKTVWYYHTKIIPFCFGMLLGTCALLFYKSASIFPSLLFVFLLFALMTINEFYKSERSRTFLWTFQLVITHAAHWIILVPILLKEMAMTPFVISLLFSLSGLSLILLWSKTPLRYLVLTLAIHIGFLGLYQKHWIPPVPLSIRYAGIYHDIVKKDEHYFLATEKPFWKFWQKGDQNFLARPGDVLHVFVQIFAPSGFKDQLKIVWQRYENEKWQTQDKISLPIYGGREQGYRGHSNKSNYTPGRWRVLIETTDSREVGRLDFSILTDQRWTERIWRVETR